nr:hypothetical protein [Haloprofundus salilacus]
MGVSVPVDTFDGFLAELLKKAIAAKWFRKVSSIGRAAKAWPNMSLRLLLSLLIRKLKT